MAIPDPSKAGSPFSPLQTDGWNPKTPEINNFFIPEIALRGGYGFVVALLNSCGLLSSSFSSVVCAPGVSYWIWLLAPLSPQRSFPGLSVRLFADSGTSPPPGGLSTSGPVGFGTWP